MQEPDFADNINKYWKYTKIYPLIASVKHNIWNLNT